MGREVVLKSCLLWLTLLGRSLRSIYANLEGDVLYSFKANLEDPNNVLQTWNATLVNPCTWYHVTCNYDNSVVRVDLGNAALSGQLVPQLGMLKNLQYLELSNNNISGPIPSDLGNLTNLVSLDLDSNSFSGEIPDTLGNLLTLRYLSKHDLEVNLVQLKRFSLKELQVATNYFSDQNILGRGGSGKVYKGRLADGTLVAVKRLKEKRTPARELQFQTEMEIISMAVHRHLLRLRGFCMTPTERLLVYPYMENGSVASCLRERPSNKPPLDWPTRRQIALDSAKGLSYLHDHCDPKIIHCGVKAANILLDKEFKAVVADFGSAKLMDYKDTHITTCVLHGTIGHIAPEYLSDGKLSEKTDVYGYGIMLLELITRHRAFDLARLANDDDMMLDWVEGLLKEKKHEILVDPDLQNNYVGPQVEQLIQVALRCTQGSPVDRPKMSEVVGMLEGGFAEKWHEWQKVELVHYPHPTYSNWIPHPNSDWIVDSLESLQDVELSGPR